MDANNNGAMHANNNDANNNGACMLTTMVHANNNGAFGKGEEQSYLSKGTALPT